MKKLLCFMLSLCLIFSLSACKADKKQNATSTPVLPEAVVASADSFEYQLSADKTRVTITKYKGKDKNIIIPDKIENAAVYSVGTAFAGTDIEQITLPASVKNIGVEAFKNCEKLHTVVLQEGLESIGNSAFFECSALKSIAFPRSLKTIGNGAFYKCTSLKKIKIPNTLQSMGYEAFRLAGLNEVEFEDGIKNIGSLFSFWCNDLKSVTVPASVESIDTQTFCGKLESITFLGDAPEMSEDSIDPRTIIYYSPDAHGWYVSPLKQTHILTEIGQTVVVNRDIAAEDYMYSVSEDKTAVYIEHYIGNDKEVTVPDTIDGLKVKGIYTAFLSTEVPLESVTIPDSVEYIGPSAFSHNKKLHTVNLGKGVKEIGNSAFYECTALKNIELPKGLKTIGNDAFYKCTSIEKITIPNTVEEWGMDVFCYTMLKEVTFEEGIKNIGGYATFWSFLLKEVTIPASVERIGDYSFIDRLESATFLGDAPKKIEEKAFDEKTVIYYDPAKSGWDTTPLKNTNTLKPIEK